MHNSPGLLRFGLLHDSGTCSACVGGDGLGCTHCAVGVDARGLVGVAHHQNVVSQAEGVPAAQSDRRCELVCTVVACYSGCVCGGGAHQRCHAQHHDVFAHWNGPCRRESYHECSLKAGRLGASWSYISPPVHSCAAITRKVKEWPACVAHMWYDASKINLPITLCKTYLKMARGIR
jgi:hypothetical protein